MALQADRLRDLSGISLQNIDEWRKRIAYWKSYPDVWYAQIKAADAPYGTLFYNDLALRVMTNYKYVFIGCTRGFTKTYTHLRARFHKCIFYQGSIETIVAPTKEQAVKVVKEALEALLKNYPVLANEFTVIADLRDTFVMLFKNGSVIRTESTANTGRGGNDTDLGVEECAQKEFDHASFNDAILPRLRFIPRYNGKIDKSAIFLQQTYLTSVRNKQNPAYQIYRETKTDMAKGKNSFVIEAPIEIPIRHGLVPKEDIERKRKRMTTMAYNEEYGAIWSGSAKGYLIKDTTLEKARCLAIAEFEYNPNGYEYLICVDIAREDGVEDAYCAIVVFRLSPITDKDRAGEYERLWKDVVFIKRYKNIDHRELAKEIKKYVRKYRAYELVIDGNGLGVATRDELMYDLGDGNPPYAVINDKDGHLVDKTIPGALPILYVLKASTKEDNDALTIPNAEVEFEQGRVRLLTREYDGLEAYKKLHRIKDDIWDEELSLPYRETNQLLEEISNIVQKAEGSYTKERRISKQIPRDIWSAVKYGLWRIKSHEDEMFAGNNFADEDWSKRFNSVKDGSPIQNNYNNNRGFLVNGRMNLTATPRPFGNRRSLFN